MSTDEEVQEKFDAEGFGHGLDWWLELNATRKHPLSEEAVLKEYNNALKHEKDEKKAKEKAAKKAEKDKAKEEMEKRVETSLWFGEDGQVMFEQVYNPKTNLSQFCAYDYKTKQVVGTEGIIKNGENNIYPISEEEVGKQAIKLPSEPIEYGTEEELDKKLKNYIYSWLDIPEEFMQFAIWSIKKSWVYDRFRTVSYLRTISDTGMGKSRFLDTLGMVHYKPMKFTANATPATVFRMIDRWKGTLLLDEADFKQSDESQDMIKIINQGFEKGNWIPRCNQNDAKKIELFDPFCPKVIGSRKPFTDKATESRCIIHHMVATSRKDIPSELNDNFDRETLEIRNMMLMWRFKNYWDIDVTKELPFIDEIDIEPRTKQIIKGFAHLCITKDQIETFKAFVIERQAEIIEERTNSFSGEIVHAYWRLKQQGKIYITSTDLIAEGGWEDQRTKKPLKPQGLSKYLTELGLNKNKVEKIDGIPKRIIQISKEDEEKMFKRYGCSKESYNVTTVTSPMQTAQSCNLLGLGNDFN